MNYSNNYYKFSSINYESFLQSHDPSIQLIYALYVFKKKTFTVLNIHKFYTKNRKIFTNYETQLGHFIQSPTMAVWTIERTHQKEGQ